MTEERAGAQHLAQETGNSSAELFISTTPREPDFFMQSVAPVHLLPKQTKEQPPPRTPVHFLPKQTAEEPPPSA